MLTLGFCAAFPSHSFASTSAPRSPPIPSSRAPRVTFSIAGRRAQAHPFFGRLDWEKLYSKECSSPLLQSVEMVAQARQQKLQRQQLDQSDQEMVPSYLSQQSCLVDDWDYVAGKWNEAGGSNHSSPRLVPAESKA